MAGASRIRKFVENAFALTSGTNDANIIWNIFWQITKSLLFFSEKCSGGTNNEINI